MKTFRRILCWSAVGLGLAGTQTATAQVSYAPEFAAATAAHERALAVLDAPIDRRYQAALTALLARAQREKDADMAAAIQQALARLLSKPAVPGAVGSVTRTAAAAAAPPPAARATPPAATPDPDATPTNLTPVGKWHWHVGPITTLTDKGAVLQGANVVGQWKWTHQDKGELQIFWSGIRNRPAETYTLSPHGNHLGGNDPVNGNPLTEDRMEP